MSLDALSLMVQELEKYQGPRDFFSGPKVRLSRQYSLLFATSSNTIWSVICHFQLKQRKWHYWNPGSASWLSSETQFKKTISFFASLLNRSKICELTQNYLSQWAAHSLSWCSLEIVTPEVLSPIRSHCSLPTTLSTKPKTALRPQHTEKIL